MQEGAGTWPFSLLRIWVYGSDFSLEWLSGRLLFPFQSRLTRHLLHEARRQKPSIHRSTQANYCFPALSVFLDPGPSLCRHNLGHVHTLFAHDTHSSYLCVCILSDGHRAWHVAGVINTCRRYKRKEEERKGRREGERQEKESSSFLFFFQVMLKPISANKCCEFIDQHFWSIELSFYWQK